MTFGVSRKVTQKCAQKGGATFDFANLRLGPGCPKNILPKNFMFRLFFSDLIDSTLKRLKTELLLCSRVLIRFELQWR